jgi:hypothetical protein
MNFFAFLLALNLVNGISSGMINREKAVDPKWFPLNIIHLNDFHARFPLKCDKEIIILSGLHFSGLKRRVWIPGYVRRARNVSVDMRGL